MKINDFYLALLVTLFWIFSFSLGSLLVLTSNNKKYNSSLEIQEQKVQQVLAVSDESIPPKVLFIDAKELFFTSNTIVEIIINKQINLQNNKHLISELGNVNNQYFYQIELKNLTYLQPKEVISIVDNFNNVQEVSIPLKWKTIPSCFYNANRDVKTTENPDRLETIVDQYNIIPNSYMPNDLINGKSNGIPTFANGSSYLRLEAFNSLKLMVDKLKSLGISVQISSGYRGPEAQENAFKYWVDLAGEQEAKKYVAPVGQSEHQLGTAVDILTAENNFKISDNYVKTKLYKWLTENAHEYGFVMTYPERKTEITGYSFEPWHFRYLGIEHAKIINQYPYKLDQQS